MIPDLRKSFNANFSEGKYRRFLQSLEAAIGTKLTCRICETPVFLPAELLAEMVQAGKELIAQLGTPEYRAASSQSIPPEYDAPNEGRHPHFVQVDFAITRDQEGRYAPKLIELQGLASLYTIQFIMAREYRRAYNLDGFCNLIGGLTDDGYLDLLRRVLLNGHEPSEVVLMDIAPLQQQTIVDFKACENLIGIRSADISDITRHGDRLFYQRDGREVEIRRVYNRVMIDEFIRKEVRADFDFRDELDVEWAGHPNWQFRMSKFSLPFLNHLTVPPSYFVDQLEEYPRDLENFVLKPLFRFGGAGVKVGVTRDDLEGLPAAERGDFLLQARVRYAPVIETLDQPCMVEVRVMFLWPDGDDDPTPATTMIRVGRGEMMGVNSNKNETWVGPSCSFSEA